MKPNKKFMARVAKTDALITTKIRAQDDAVEKLRAQYDIDEWVDCEEEYTDDHYNYCENLGQIMYDYEHDLAVLSAQRAALILLAYHIAHRNKPLISKTIKRNAKKLGKYGDFVLQQLDTSYNISPLPILGPAPHLHRALSKYGVTLVDEKQIHNLEQKLNSLADQKEELEAILSQEICFDEPTTKTTNALSNTNHRIKLANKKLSKLYAIMHKKRTTRNNQMVQTYQAEIPF